MTRGTHAVAKTSMRALRIWSGAASRWRMIAALLVPSYRPEMHYMRGPGPKWYEKHGRNGLAAD
jgi:hypothetical protein